MERLLPAKIQILAFLERNGPARGTKISRELGISVSATYAALRELRAAGLIKYNEVTKQYEITDKGKAELERIRRELVVGVTA